MSGIAGYTEPWIASPGEELQVKVSCPDAQIDYTVEHVLQPHEDAEYAPKNSRIVIPTQTYMNARIQRPHIGSYFEAFLPQVDPDELGVRGWIYPTYLSRTNCGSQIIFSFMDKQQNTGAELLIKNRSLLVRVATIDRVEQVETKIGVEEFKWSYFTFELHQNELKVTLKRKPEVYKYTNAEQHSIVRLSARCVLARSCKFYLAARFQLGETPEDCFTGRIDSITVQSLKVLAAWDFALECQSDRVVDRSKAGNDGFFINAPTRAVCGHDWDVNCGPHTKEMRGYGAVHFHEDDLDDARWRTDFVVKLPQDLHSGVYVIRLRTVSKNEHEIVFFVRPKPNSHANVAFVIDTFTYLAYANEHLYEKAFERDGNLVPKNDNIYANIKAFGSSVGLSLYDTHVDGHGVVYSSYKRPILNNVPAYIHPLFKKPRELSIDAYFINWLHMSGINYDVIFSHDISRSPSCIAKYKTVVTNSHPEYPTQSLLAAYENYLSSGGNVMYLGGNGFYWVTSEFDQAPWRIEVRRGLSGCRAYSSPPGELNHSSTGELGGLWRNRGKAPNSIFGVGSIAAGIGKGVGFRVTHEGQSPGFDWVFQGVDRNEIIGSFGMGACGDEIDCIDEKLGTPPNCVVLATTTTLSSNFSIFPEEANYPYSDTDGPTNPKVRSDMIFFETEAGGAVFSVGSIHWIWNMAFNNYDNNVAMVTANVLKRFMAQ